MIRREEDRSDHLPGTGRCESAVYEFKPTAPEHVARAWEMVAILEREDVLIWTIRPRRTGYVYCEDEALVFTEIFGDVKPICTR